jgi:hypothetical protein
MYRMAIPEDLDLIALVRQLASHFAGAAPVGYVRGKSALRTAVVRILRCSELEAEQLVDTLEGRGLIRYEGDRLSEIDDLENRWRFAGPQSS